jgi:Protein of unknown function (DUF3631)
MDAICDRIGLKRSRRAELLMIARGRKTLEQSKAQNKSRVKRHTGQRKRPPWTLSTPWQRPSPPAVSSASSIASDPEMPPLLRNRAADNWRVLLSVADDFGYGEDARSAAVTLSANRPDEDPGVTLLDNIRGVFQALGVDRIASSALVEELIGLDDGLWNEWRGPHDDGSPRTLTQGELSRLLRPFGIRPKTVWPARRSPSITGLSK